MSTYRLGDFKTQKTKNGKYSKINEVAIPRKGEGGDAEITKTRVQLTQTKARYFKVHIKNQGVLPKWHPSAGNPSWLFVDEIYFW